MMKKNGVRNLTLAGLFLALGLLLPFLTGQIPTIGRMLLPMHIPVLLVGFVCGWPYGLMVGLVCPVLRSMLFGMPHMFPRAVAMSFELAAYGFATGLLYRLFPKKNWYIYGSLLIAMVFGRIIWAIASMILYQLSGAEFTWEMFMANGFINALPGIILQIILIPVIVVALKKAQLLQEA